MTTVSPESETAPSALVPTLYSIEQAAAKLAPVITADWLRKHLAEIPHIRAGVGRGRAGRVGFTDAHLAEIIATHEVRPGPPDIAVVPERITRRRRAS